MVCHKTLQCLETHTVVAESDRGPGVVKHRIFFFLIVAPVSCTTSVVPATMSKFTKNNSLLSPYLSLPQNGKIAAEYVWLDAAGMPRAKTTTCNGPIRSLSDLKEWNFDGSSTGQAPGDNSDVYLSLIHI